MDSLPYWPNDPLVDRNAHRLEYGPEMHGGWCSCGTWYAPSRWDHHAVTEAFDWHMNYIQLTAHGRPADARG